MILVRLASGNGIDITEAIWFSAGRLPALRTVGSALLSIVSSAWGLPWAAKARQSKLEPLSPMRFPIQPSCPTNNAVCWWRAAPERGWPRPMECRLAARLFAIEVLRGILALRLVLPALLTSLIATLVSWTVLPDAPTYFIPSFQSSASVICWAMLAGPVMSALCD